MKVPGHGKNIEEKNQSGETNPKLTQMLELEDKGKTSLAIQWLSSHLLMQGIWVQPLVWGDSTRHRATEPVHHSY